MNSRSGFLLSLVLLASTCPSSAQQPQQQTQPPASQPATPTTPSTQGQQVVETQKPPPQEPYMIEDGGFSIEPMYWLNRAQPQLFGGAKTTGLSGLNYPGNAKPSLGGEFSMPAGRANTLRFSYFRTQGNANTTETLPVTIFGEGYSPGDYLVATYTIQSAKVSWDYLSYTWYKPAGKIRFKTLYEVQYTNISTSVAAPLKPETSDTSGNVNTNIASGSKKLIYPSLGGEFEQALGHHFRWEVKGSGFAIPHHSTIWDAEGSIAIRFGKLELFLGEKALHFKTSRQADQYFVDTLSGAYAGLRFYWGPRT